MSFSEAIVCFAALSLSAFSAENRVASPSELA
jgi:hypothetical protein